ncbi:unnamed protein product, partial [Phaeothamnion confervicola]
GGGSGGRQAPSQRDMPRRAISDVCRSDYEQQQIIKELVAAESMRLRIANGGVKVPAMLSREERRLIPEVVDRSNARLTTDGAEMACASLEPHRTCGIECNCPRAMERERKMINPWTDMEKCIFLDKFMQHPKNFPKIASFLANKNTKDLVRFYYDSKQVIDYKGMLREHQLRRKYGRAAWTATAAAAKCCGATVHFDPETGEASFSLPAHDVSYQTLLAHPPAAVADPLDVKRLALTLA